MKCPESEPFALYMDTIGLLCVEECPLFYNHTNKHCTTTCKSLYVMFNKSCKEKCPPRNPYHEEVSNGIECVLNCKRHRHDKQCESYCPKEAQYSYKTSCVEECGEDLPFIQANYIYDKTYSGSQEYICVESCPRHCEMIYNKS